MYKETANNKMTTINHYKIMVNGQGMVHVGINI